MPDEDVSEIEAAPDASDVAEPPDAELPEMWLPAESDLTVTLRKGEIYMDEAITFERRRPRRDLGF
jgi:hypothetical protein